MAQDNNPQFTKPDVWLDDDHFIEWVHMPNESEACGGLLWHTNPARETGWCMGAFYWKRPTEDMVIGDHGMIPPQGSLWQLESTEPLTLSPSLVCHCGNHGFIKQGKWIQA